MPKTIFMTASDNGDGSMSVQFYDSQECIDKLEDRDPESYRGEGGTRITIHEDGKIEGIKIQTMEDVNEYLSDMGFDEEEEDED